MVMLMSDSYDVRSAPEWIGPEEASHLESYGHPLYSTGGKTTRVSHNTSHGESLAMLNGTQVGQLIANRVSEPFFHYYLCQRIPWIA